MSTTWWCRPSAGSEYKNASITALKNAETCGHAWRLGCPVIRGLCTRRGTPLRHAARRLTAGADTTPVQRPLPVREPPRRVDRQARADASAVAGAGGGGEQPKPADLGAAARTRRRIGAADPHRTATRIPLH